MSQPANNALNELKGFAGIIHRQPLFDRKLKVNGYYLSFLNNQGQPLEGEQSPPDFVSNLPQILQAVSPGKQCILSIPTQWHAHLPSSSVIDVDIILLSDNQRSASNPENYQRAAFATDADNDCHTLLMDFQKTPKTEIQNALASDNGDHQVACAINVNDAEDFQWCADRDITQLTGHFYTRPHHSQASKAQPSQQQLLQLLVELNDPDTDAETLAQIINQDVTLSYKLLKLVNSAFFGLPREITNTRQAIVMLGQNKIKTWASLLCLSGVDDKPSELRRIAMQRARMCELLARHYKGQPESFFICGLLSTLDALLDKPLTDIIQGLPLHPDIELALTEYEGAAGAALSDTIAYERAQWSTLARSSMPVEVLVSAYLDAVVWTGELDQQLQD